MAYVPDVNPPTAAPQQLPWLKLMFAYVVSVQQLLVQVVVLVVREVQAASERTGVQRASVVEEREPSLQSVKECWSYLQANCG